MQSIDFFNSDTEIRLNTIYTTSDYAVAVEIFKKLSVLGIPPSEISDDASFLRRVTIDITGRIPTLDETNEFLTSTIPDKRAKKIDALLDTSEYADYFAGKWAGLLRNKSNRGLAWVSRDTFAFHSWLRTSLIENKPFDELVGELITASGKTGENPAASWYRAVTTASVLGHGPPHPVSTGS